MHLQRQKFLCKIILYLIVVFTGYSVRFLKHFAASALLTGLTELHRESETCAVGAGSRVPSWSPFEFSSCPARKAAGDRRQDRPKWLTFECSGWDSTSDCFSAKTHPSCPLSQASQLPRCSGTYCKAHAGLNCFLVNGLLQLRLDFESSECGFVFGCLTIVGQCVVHSSCQT